MTSPESPQFQPDKDPLWAAFDAAEVERNADIEAIKRDILKQLAEKKLFRLIDLDAVTQNDLRQKYLYDRSLYHKKRVEAAIEIGTMKAEIPLEIDMYAASCATQDMYREINFEHALIGSMGKLKYATTHDPEYPKDYKKNLNWVFQIMRHKVSAQHPWLRTYVEEIGGRHFLPASREWDIAVAQASQMIRENPTITDVLDLD